MTVVRLKFVYLLMLNYKKNFSRLAIVIIFLLLFVGKAFALENSPTESNAAEIFIPAQKNNIYVDNYFEVPIYLNTKGQSLNVLDLRIKYDPTKIEVASLTTGDEDPIFGFWVEFPKYDNKKGEISLIGVILNGVNTDSGFISSINFKAINPGQNIFSLSSLSTVYLNDGKGTKANLIINSSPYEILEKKIDDFIITINPPVDSENWLPEGSITLDWPALPDSLGYSILLSKDPNALPNLEINQTENSIKYDNVSDGEWFFSLRVNNNGVWSEPYSSNIKVDTMKPDDFILNIKEQKNVFGPSDYLISFLTKDLPSGIDHYEITFSELINGIPKPSDYIRAESPYLFKTGGLNYKNPTRVIVRAYDKAGNFSEAYQDLNFNKRFNFNFSKYFSGNYRYYWCWLFWIVIILLILWLLYRLYKYLKKKMIKKEQKNISDNEINSNPDSLNEKIIPILIPDHDQESEDMPLPPYIEKIAK